MVMPRRDPFPRIVQVPRIFGHERERAMTSSSWRFRLSLLILLGLVVYTLLPASPLTRGQTSDTWTQISLLGGSPPARSAHSAVWDAANPRMLVFGGNGGSYFEDLWAYDGAAWAELTPTGTAPPRREEHSAVWDTPNGRMLVFGGFNGNTSTRVNDLWSFNGTAWTQLNPTGSLPVARHGHSAVWDTTGGRMLVFGGFTSPSGRLNDLWSYDGANWTELMPPNSPPVRTAHTAVWDSTNARMLVFGGSGNTGRLSDLWSYDGGKLDRAHAAQLATSPGWTCRGVGLC
jgi:hypothetical protein